MCQKTFKTVVDLTVEVREGRFARVEEFLYFAYTNFPHVIEAFGDRGGMTEDVLDAIRAGRKIDAIRAYRAVNYCGLKEAKEAVEQYAWNYGYWPRPAQYAS